MDIDKLINDIDKLIKYSRFYLYDSEEDREEAVRRLKEMKKDLEKGKLYKVFREGSDSIDDS